MEVMSTLLLCAFVALFPQTLGVQTELRNSAGNLMIRNNLKMIQQKGKHKVLLNLNGQPLVTKVSELQNVFNDVTCSACIECMERAILANRDVVHFKEEQLPSQEIQEEEKFINALRTHREKRDVNDTVIYKTGRKSKSKTSKGHRHVTVTKYTLQGVTHALKVKEYNSADDVKSNCGIYSISNTFQCNSPEAKAFLASVKRKQPVTKKNRRDFDASSTVATPRSVTMYRKRDIGIDSIDNSQIPDNSMASFEDFY